MSLDEQYENEKALVRTMISFLLATTRTPCPLQH
jgi:hypothetical protein